MPTTIQVEIPEKPEEVPATELGRDRQRVLDGLLRGRVYVVTRWSIPIGYIVPLPPELRPAGD